MSHRLLFRDLSVRVLALSALALAAACSDDPKTGGTQPGDATTTVASATVPGESTTLPLDVPTTFISDCSQMPTSVSISAIVGIPLDDGQVVAAGTCQFTGFNEQNRTITLALLQDPGDVAAFYDLEVSLGASALLNDPALPDMSVDPTSLVYIYANGWAYSVRAAITDGTPAEQVPLAAAVLKMWFGV